MSLFLVDLPAPIHGMSVMNRKFVHYMAPTFVVNTAPSFAKKFFDGPIWLVAKLVLSFYVLFRIVGARLSGEKVCYRTLNGGKGQLIDLIYLFALRILGFKIYLHHHSFSYLSCVSRLFLTLLFVGGRDLEHIVLGSRMRDRLVSLYGVSSTRIRVVSNSVFFEPKGLNLSSAKDKTTPVLGYMANLTLEKGVGTFIDLCCSLRDDGEQFNAVIAGPVAGDGVQEKLDLFVSLDGFKYAGPVYGDAKEEFLGSIDVFVFPSQYRNEAEPLVLYEAAQYGATVLVTDTGCLADVANALAGHSVLLGSDMAEDLLQYSKELLSSVSNDSKQNVLDKLAKHISANVDELKHLEKELSGVSAS